MIRIRGIHRLLARSITAGKLHADSLQNPSEFWSKAGQEISWIKDGGPVMHSNSHFTKWFPERSLNMATNCLFRHLPERKSQPAIIYDSPVTKTHSVITYGDLSEKVLLLASALRDQGVTKGDRVLIYMPNIPEAAIAMLSCATIGAIHSVVFGGFAPAELATRIRDSSPKVIILASCGIDGTKLIPYKPLVESALKIVGYNSTTRPKCIVFQRPQSEAILLPSIDFNWAEVCNATKSRPLVSPVEVNSTDPLYILYTSGTTGAPKGVVRDTGGYAVALKWSMWNCYGLKPGEVFWAASDVGWVVGHSYSVYGPLLHGCSTVIYEGKPVGTPDAGAFWRVIEQYGVSALFTAPTAIRAIKRADHAGDFIKAHNISSLRSLFLAGEHADPDTVKWAERVVRVPVLDHWWQTETGWPICCNLTGPEGIQPIKYGSTFRPCPGYDLQSLDDSLNPVPRGQLGSLAIRLPLPPGCMTTLYNADERYVNTYMTKRPGYYDTGDAGIIDEDGYVFVMSRTDDVINVAGHRLSTGAMEEILSEHPDIAEVAVIGIKDPMKGQVPVALYVVYDSASNPKSEDQIVNEAVAMIRTRIGAVACFKNAFKVKRLPKTRSGKVLRGTMRAMANGDAYSMPSTIEDPDVLAEIATVIKNHEEDLAKLHIASQKDTS